MNGERANEGGPEAARCDLVEVDVDIGGGRRNEAE